MISMKILALSDIELGQIFSPAILQRYRGTDIVISCGDLPFDYLEYVVSMLNVPLYYVLGNHAHVLEMESGETRHAPGGASNLHRKCLKDPSGLLLAGIEGSIRYNDGPHQYTQEEMWMMIWGLIPHLVINRILHGRYLDIFITHAPPWKIHDKDDLPHQGIKAFRWLVERFQPLYHLHGHIHLYRQDVARQTKLQNTLVINAFGSVELQVNPETLKRPNNSHPKVPTSGGQEQ